MTKDEWRYLCPNDLVTLLNDKHLYKVVSVGYGDLTEKDFQDENDYIIEIKEYFGKQEGNFIVRAHQTQIASLDIPLNVLQKAKTMTNPYDFISGYLYCKRTHYLIKKIN